MWKAKGQDVVQRSVLGPVLPEAMVCYLENYEPEHFSEIFLGEFDTPEAIWSSEMRCIITDQILIIGNIKMSLFSVLVYMFVHIKAYDDREDRCSPG